MFTKNNFKLEKEKDLNRFNLILNELQDFDPQMEILEPNEKLRQFSKGQAFLYYPDSNDIDTIDPVESAICLFRKRFWQEEVNHLSDGKTPAAFYRLGEEPKQLKLVNPIRFTKWLNRSQRDDELDIDYTNIPNEAMEVILFYRLRGEFSDVITDKFKLMQFKNQILNSDNIIENLHAFVSRQSFQAYTEAKRLNRIPSLSQVYSKQAVNAGHSSSPATALTGSPESQIREYIANGHFEEAIVILRKITQGGCYDNDATSLQGRFNKLEREKAKKIIRQDDYDRSLAQIRESIFYILKKI